MGGRHLPQVLRELHVVLARGKRECKVRRCGMLQRGDVPAANVIHRVAQRIDVDAWKTSAAPSRVSTNAPRVSHATESEGPERSHE